MTDHNHTHDHDHDHGHDHGLFGHAHSHGESDADANVPLDAASQSLADALRQSFRILKGIMGVLVVLYLASGIKFLEPNESAVIFRLGDLQPTVYTSGLLLAWPFPIDDVVRLPVKESTDLVIDSHMLWLSEEDKAKGMKFVTRGHEGLDPNRDGALLTGDKGLVHIQWVVTYKISDLALYIRGMTGKGMGAADELVRTLVEGAGVEVASGMTAEDVYRERLDVVCTAVKSLVNQRLSDLGSGITVVQVKAPLAIVPVQIRETFEQTQQAENKKEQSIQQAFKDRTEMLNKTAGRACDDILRLLDQLEAAKTAGNKEQETVLANAIATTLEGNDAAGEAGQLIKQASAHYTIVVSEMESDLQLYRTLLPEFNRNSQLLFERLWDEARNDILNSNQVTKIFRPFDTYLTRIRFGPDPEQKKLDEMEQNLKKTDHAPPRKPVHYDPIGPEFD